MSDNLSNYPITMCLSAASLAAGTTTTYTASALTGVVRSKIFLRAAAANTATPTSDVVTALPFKPQTFPANANSGGTGSVYVFCYVGAPGPTTAASNIRVAQGTIEALDINGNFINLPQFPVLPDNVFPFGTLFVRLGPTAVANWTFGTSNLSGVTGVTYNFQDVAMIPDRPQSS